MSLCMVLDKIFNIKRENFVSVGTSLKMNIFEISNNVNTPCNFG